MFSQTISKHMGIFLEGKVWSNFSCGILWFTQMKVQNDADHHHHVYWMFCFLIGKRNLGKHHLLCQQQSINHHWAASTLSVLCLRLQTELKSSSFFFLHPIDHPIWIQSRIRSTLLVFRFLGQLLGPGKQEQLSAANPLGTPDAPRTDDAPPLPLLDWPPGTRSLAVLPKTTQLGRSPWAQFS